MAKKVNFTKNNPNDFIWWVENPGRVGEWLFSFDKKKSLQYVCRLSLEINI